LVVCNCELPIVFVTLGVKVVVGKVFLLWVFLETMKTPTIEIATGEIGRRSGVGLCGLDYPCSQPQILMPVQTQRPISEAMPQVRKF
jgi:hypothetical protein